MTRITLEISQDKDLELLLALLERLNIRVVKKSASKDQAGLQDDDTFILNGLPARKDFEAFLLEFEESRKDRPLPREN